MKGKTSFSLFVMWAGFAAAAIAGGNCPTCGDASGGGKAKHEVLTPCEFPVRFAGRWKISLCIFVKCGDPGHSWLRYQNCETGEIHTVGRYQKDHGGTKNPDTGEWVYPPAPISGVIYDLDLKREKQLLSGEAHAISCYVNDPIVWRGENGGFGHGGHRANCVTHCRDGWQYFTGERYDVGVVFQSPLELQKEIVKRHPDFLGGRKQSPFQFAFPQVISPN